MLTEEEEKKLNKQVFKTENPSSLSEELVRVRAIEFLYNQLGSIEHVSFEAVKLAAKALGCDISAAESDMHDQVIVSKNFEIHGGMFCSVNAVSKTDFPKDDEAMWKIIQSYDYESAKNKVEYCIEILQRTSYIDQAYPMLDHYLRFGADSGIEGAAFALAQYEKLLKDISFTGEAASYSE